MYIEVKRPPAVGAEPVLRRVNIDAIDYYEPRQGQGSFIKLRSGEKFQCLESPDEIYHREAAAREAWEEKKHVIRARFDQP